MYTHDFATVYRSEPDERLLRLAAEAEGMTPEARSALSSELAVRGIGAVLAPPVSTVTARPKAVATSPVEPAHLFISNVLRLYRQHFWLFLKLSAPAVVLAFLAVMFSREAARDLVRELPRGAFLISRPATFLKVALLNQAGMVTSWLLGSFSFGAICVAVREFAAGAVPSVKQSVSVVLSRARSVLNFSVALYALMFAMAIIAVLVFEIVIYFTEKWQIGVNGNAISICFWILFGAIALLLSRFAVSIPAVVLDGVSVRASFFRSFELTKGKWLVLASLLTESLLGGYVVAYAPFWIAQATLSNAQLPSWFQWFLSSASVAGVSLLEPLMFIGFSLLYQRALPSTPAATSPDTNFSQANSRNAET